LDADASVSLSGKKILITGADGFIGSHLCEACIRQGAEVRAFVLYNSFGRAGWLDYVADDIRASLEVFPGDLRDPQATLLATAGRDMIVHLAALIAIPYSYRAPDSYVDTNVKGILNLLNAARVHEVGHFIHTSTSEVYGTAEYVPIDERHPVAAQSPYAATKIAADQLAMSYYCSFGVPVTLLRPFNTYGPRQSARAIIPTIIIQALDRQGEVRLGNLAPSRDFTYISDIVDGYIKCMTTKKVVGELINLGSGHEISIEDLVKKIGVLLGQEIRVQHDSERVRPGGSEVPRLFCNRSEAERLLGWEPSVSLDEGLKRTISWLQEHRHLPDYVPDRYTV
jgi:NAD dependent epimerase/dehydratase